MKRPKVRENASVNYRSPPSLTWTSWELTHFPIRSRGPTTAPSCTVARPLLPSTSSIGKYLQVPLPSSARRERKPPPSCVFAWISEKLEEGKCPFTLRSSWVPDITILGISLGAFQRTSANALSWAQAVFTEEEIETESEVHRLKNRMKSKNSIYIHKSCL